MKLTSAKWIAPLVLVSGFLGCATPAATTPAENAPASVDPNSNSPYIDKIRNELKPDKPAAKEKDIDPNRSYTEQIQEKLKAKDGDSKETYIERLRRENPALNPPEAPSSYTANEAAKLPPKPEGGAIAAVNEGRSDLDFKRPGDIHHAAGFTFGDVATRNVTAINGAGLSQFGDVYGNSGFVPALNFFYEWQPFHSEWYGNFGIVSTAGFSYENGSGVFQNPDLVNASTKQRFGSKSQTSFKFVTLPLTAGLNYRLNLLRVVRPFVAFEGMAIGYFEGRNDNVDARKGYSFGTQFTTGLNILIDGLSRTIAWDLYEDYGIKKTYLTISFNRISTFSGDIRFENQQYNAGFTYEF